MHSMGRKSNHLCNQINKVVVGCWFWVLFLLDERSQAQLAQYNEFLESGPKN